MPRYKLGSCNLPEILKEMGVSNQDFADKMDMTRQQAHDTIHGKKEMKAALLLSVCETYDIDPMRVYNLIPLPRKDRSGQQP